MRTDEQIAAELDSTGMVEQRWKGGATSGWMEEPGGEISLSISGYERNRLFLGAGGSQFRDLSGVSGLDALADGRATTSSSVAIYRTDEDGRTACYAVARYEDEWRRAGGCWRLAERVVALRTRLLAIPSPLPL